MESEENRLLPEQVEQYLHDAYNALIKKMTSQLLADEKLNDSWLSVVRSISSRVAQKVDANCLKDAFEMDVRRLVKLKTIVGGSKADSAIIKGLVFTKNVVHRRMKQNISNPCILLLSCPLVYEHQSLTSLDVVKRHERSYLQNIVARIVSLSPDILVVEQSVARIAQEMLLDCEITLVTNVKSSLIERLSMFTGADIVYSLDFQEKPTLGRCDNFYVQTFHSKTLMYFDGCPQHSGCTVILRGSHLKQELKKIKQICSFMIFCDYNWRLEKSFLMDVGAVPKSMFAFETCDVRLDLNDKGSESFNEESDSCDRKVEPVAVEDNSDPLRSMAEEANTSCISAVLSSNDETNAAEQSEITISHLVKRAILSSSPFIDVKMPYLLTDESSNCSLKRYISTGNLYWTKRYSLLNVSAVDNSRLTVDDSTVMKDELCNLSDLVHFKREHPFYSRQLTQTVANSSEIQSLLADFRARGGVLSYKQQTSNTEISKSTEEIKEPFCDALHPKLHQRIPVLYCSYSYSSQNPFCVSPAVVEMEFYGACDISLGGFLEKYCFFHAYSCPVSGCNIAMTEHTRKFIHDSGSVQINLKQLKSSVEAAENNIITWSWCQYCKSSTKYTVLSPDSWCLSFAKYLELIINGSKYVRRVSQGTPPCLNHTLFNDNVQYFAFKQMVASFKFCPIEIREIEMPPPKIQMSVETLSVSALTDELKSITIKGYDVLSSILGTVCNLKEESSTPKHEVILSEFLACEISDRLLFRSKIDENHIQLANTPDVSQRLAIADNLVLLQKYIADVVSQWNSKFQDFSSIKKKDEKSSKASNQNKPASSNVENDQLSSVITVVSQLSEEAEEAIEPNTETTVGDVSEEQCVTEDFSNTPDDPQACILDFNSVKACMYAQQEECHNKLEELDKIVVEDPNDLELQNQVEKFVSSDSSVSSVAYGVTSGISALLSKDAVLSEDDETYAVYHMNTASLTENIDDQKKIDETASVSSLSTLNEQNRSITSNFTEKENFKQTTVKTIINQLLSSSSNLVIESPFEPSEHFLQSTRDKLPIIVRDNDPGSIVAFCLASTEYDKMLNDMLRSTVSPNTKKKLTVDILNDSKEFESSLPSTSTNTKMSVTNTQDLHIDLQFCDASCKFHCCVYFAEQFRRLRSETLEVCQNSSTNSSYASNLNSTESIFIRSISKTIPWKARGGKSASNFFKTANDRFILKEMSTAEMQSFLSIAKHYFEYIANAAAERRPTLLAKIVGVYKISAKNSVTNSTTKMFVLVLENIFYKRDITQKFDLKGSVRNRLASTNTPDEVVLLDENLIKMTRETPFYIRNHTKKILQLTIANDSLFLSNLSLMDYSLLVGIDEQRKEFIVGIIDYIRNFTWDKKLEMMVKSVGSHGKTPTIVSPDVYRERFREKMDQYFLDVPDRWYKLETNEHCFTFSPFNS